MADNLQFPFNHAPVSLGFADNTSYTVPAGKYARVLFCYSASAYTYAGDPGQSISVTTDNQNGVFEIWLRDGDIIDATTVVANANAGASDKQLSGFSRINITVNGTIAKRVYAYATASSGGSTPNLFLRGNAAFTISAEEYNIVS